MPHEPTAARLKLQFAKSNGITEFSLLRLQEAGGNVTVEDRVLE